MGGLVQHLQFDSEASWLQKVRSQGLSAFTAQGVPTAKTEAWKYTKPRELCADDYILTHLSGVEDDIELPFDGYVFHFDNGILVSPLPQLPAGVEVIPLAQALQNDFAQDYIGQAAVVANRPFAALNQYYLSSGLCIHILPQVKLGKPLVFINHTVAEAENLFANLHNLVVLEQGAQAELIEYYHYRGVVKSRYFNNIVNEIFLHRDSSLQHYKVQAEAFKADHVALNAVRAEQNASYKSFTLQTGANVARNETFVRLVAEQAAAEVDAAYIMNGWATIDTTTDIEHLSPCTYSQQLVKGVVGGDAKGVFQGKIHIAPQAIKTEGRQLHKALLLSDKAEIDAKPELEIFADDVKCSHGAATGELDEEQLFYMQSRGIGREEARRILIDAYLDDVISKIEDEKVAAWIKLLSNQG